MNSEKPFQANKQSATDPSGTNQDDEHQAAETRYTGGKESPADAEATGLEVTFEVRTVSGALGNN